jgi:peptidoglycan/LPS O-acetylase OafA/YrhL
MKEKNFFNELTGIRAIAAYLVFFNHFNVFSNKEFGGILYAFVNEFYIGVTIFFVLSGFLICIRYYDNIKIRDHKWIVQYVQNRVARIFPMYFLLTTLTFAIISMNSPKLLNTIFQYIASITFLKGFFNQYKYVGILQGWTLTIEECFYFSAPFIFIFSRKIKPIILFLFIFLSGIMLVLVFREINFHGFFENFKFMLVYTYFGRCFEFFIGISLAFIYKRKYQGQSVNTGYRTIAGILWIVICIMLLAIVKGKEDYGILTPYGIIINNIILPVGVAVLFLGLITEKTIIKKILGSKLFVLLGKSSYTFYLIHLGILSTLISKFTDSIPVKFLLINIIAVVLFKTIEERCNNFIRKIDFYPVLSTIKRKTILLTSKRLS